ncbi:MAG: PIG-L family deacetylase [Bacteroidota bacterium]
MKNRRKIAGLVVCLFSSMLLFAQAPAKLNSSQIRQNLDKLQVLGSVLYVAAHPDDENTRMIAYFANAENMRTAYLSATRGDGGQNLIGPEIREKLGIIRTQELLAARRTDGGQQFFSRANDFGYSKHPDETFNIWDREEVLKDFVWVIRKFRPDIMITRFSEQPGITHGHHTASAILAREAFKLAGDKNAYPEQLQYVDVWQPAKLFWNTSSWFYRKEWKTMDKSIFKTVDVGAYNALSGLSYSEVASLSRSMHKSQGFGSTGSRGQVTEYLQQLEGKDTGDIWTGINTSWSRVTGGKAVQAEIQKAIDDYDPTSPEMAVPYLLQALNEMKGVKNEFWKEIKGAEIKEMIKACMGLYLEARAEEFAYVPGDEMKISYELINRSDIGARVTNIYLNEIRATDQNLSQELENNASFKLDHQVKLPESFDYSNPYWLIEDGSLGMYKVKDQLMRGKPENDPAITVTYQLEIEGIQLDFTSPLIFKRNDPVDGEVYRPLEIVPPVFANIDADVLLFSNNVSKPVEVTVTSGGGQLNGTLSLNLPEGWSASPQSFDVALTQKGEEKKYTFSITPPAQQSREKLSAQVTIDSQPYDNGLTRITYDHIPVQGIYTTDEASLIKVNLERKGELIGYIMGAGDDIPANLQQIGYQVELLGKEQVVASDLAKYDAVILGVRALNTEGWLSFKMSELLEYTKNGGNLIIQYNTNRRMVTDQFSPYPIKVSRDRVTVEEAPVRILAEKHPVMNTPNKISDKDFEGWVQERGLYFPNEWSDEFTAILSSNDPGEPARDGGLLVARYGKGYYVYTGYSWFRELPAGVPGAYRIFTNIISLGKK